MIERETKARIEKKVEFKKEVSQLKCMSSKKNFATILLMTLSI